MKEVWHVYYGTRGTAGAYVDALLKASKIAGVNARAFVSCNYRFKSGRINKCFFPITDFCEKRNRLIVLLRGVELTLAYLLIFMRAMFSRPVVVLHLIDDLSVTFYLSKAFKMIGLELRVTCHDINSHYSGMNSIRHKILKMADKLIIHNDAARQILVERLGKNVQCKIHSYPFPFSAYNEIISPDRLDTVQMRLRREVGTGYYLFLGVVRRSKGIETLVKAWGTFNKDRKEQLVIAGRWTDPPDEIRKMAETDDTVVIVDRYLDDEEFVQFIRDSKFVVLPYLDYAHSSVIISCGNHGGAVIMSDIDLFRQFLEEYKYTFKSGDVGDLIRVLRQTATLSDDAISFCRTRLQAAVELHNRDLVTELKEVYRE